MTATPHILNFNAPADPNRTGFNVRIFTETVDFTELIQPPPSETGNYSENLTPFMTGKPQGEYNVQISSVGNGGESDPISAGGFTYYPVPLPVTSASVS